MYWVDNTLIMTGKDADLVLLMRGRLRFNKILPDLEVKEEYRASLMPRISKSDMVLLDGMRQPTLLVNFHSLCEPPTTYLNYLTTHFEGLKIANTYIYEGWTRVGHSYSVNGNTSISILQPQEYGDESLKQFSSTCEWFNYDTFTFLYPSRNPTNNGDVVLINEKITV